MHACASVCSLNILVLRLASQTDNRYACEMTVFLNPNCMNLCSFKNDIFDEVKYISLDLLWQVKL